jgi:hypothetical protein
MVKLKRIRWVDKLRFWWSTFKCINLMLGSISLLRCFEVKMEMFGQNYHFHILFTSMLAFTCFQFRHIRLTNWDNLLLLLQINRMEFDWIVVYHYPTTILNVRSPLINSIICLLFGLNCPKLFQLKSHFRFHYQSIALTH